MSKIIRQLYVLTISLYLVSVCLAIVYFAVATPRNELRVHFLDVGQGDAILIETPERAQILIDAGPDRTVRVALASILPWWDHSIDYALITHPDLDHYGGFADAMRAYRIGQFIWNGDDDPARQFQSLVRSIREEGIPLRTVSEGDTFAWPSGVVMKVLWPPNGYSSEKNGRSIVVLVSYGDQDFLLTGDLSSEEERILTERRSAIEAEVLKAGHHGSRTSSDPLFLSAVDPDVCIISAGRNNRYGHPHAEVLDRLAAEGCVMYSTLDGGTQSFASDGHTTVAIDGAFALWKSLKYAILGMF